MTVGDRRSAGRRRRRPGRRASGGRASTAARPSAWSGAAPSCVALIAGGLPAFVAVEYRDTFAGAIGAASLAGLAENPAIRTLFGRPVALDDPGGFTVWRTGTVLAVLVGVWAALTATRLTRGEEEAGRWDLLLAGRLRLRFAGGELARRRPASPRPSSGAAVGARPGAGRHRDDRCGAVRRRSSAARAWSARASASLAAQLAARAAGRLRSGRRGAARPASWCAWSPTACPALAWAHWLTPVRAASAASRPTPPTGRSRSLVLAAGIAAPRRRSPSSCPDGRDVGAGLAPRPRLHRARHRLARVAAGLRRAPRCAGRCWAGGPAWRRTSC